MRTFGMYVAVIIEEANNQYLSLAADPLDAHVAKERLAAAREWLINMKAVVSARTAQSGAAIHFTPWKKLVRIVVAVECELTAHLDGIETLAANCTAQRARSFAAA